MREVKLHISNRNLGDVLSELRVWFDHNDCVPVSFDLVRDRRQVLVARVLFDDDSPACAFWNDFRELERG